ncbi:MAG: 2-oxo acid dehydrogenase subunit E2 [Deltaproteobacteria bacterium]|nr:2-oxo acid dehydrogenase subunit E2 [Deltaproteobacteria bacterium]
MVTQFKLPELGEDIATGDVISVYVSNGDRVSKDQPLMEIETDKAAIEVPAPVSGVITGVHVKEGETINVGQLLVTIDESGEEKEEPEVKEEIREVVEESTEERIEAEEKKTEEKIAEVKSKAEPKGKGRAEIEEKEYEEKAASMEEEGKVVEFARSSQAGVERETPRKIVSASPSVRRLARELGVDITQIKGSGPGGRISEEDVKKYASKRISKASPEEIQVRKADIALPDFTKWGEIERKPMSKVRRLTAERMTSSWRAPHVTQHDKADITELEKTRKRFSKTAENADGKLTVTAILIKVVGSALKIFQQFNASVDMTNGEVIHKKYYNIAVAVDTDRGLLAPVIKDVDKKNLIEIAVELTQLSERARNKKITVEELQGGTFTISNLGGLGGTYFTPVIYSPDVALLGVSRSNMEPVFIDDRFEPRVMLPLSLSYDHRIIDGADAVRFLRWIVEALEQPFKLMLEG